MADENLAIAPTEQAQPAIETEVSPADEPERLPSPAEAADTTTGLEPVEDELDDWQHADGKTYKVPKALTKHLMLDRDYTQGKQQIAEMRRAIESEATQTREAAEAELDARATLRTVRKDLESYSQMTQADWDELHAQDPMGSDQHWRNFHFLKEQKADLEGRLSKVGEERTQLAQQDLAKRVEATIAEAPKFIPGFKPEMIGSLIEYAVKEYGVQDSQLKQLWSPALLKLLHRAQIGDQLLSKQAQKPIPQQIAPLATVNGKTSPAARGDLASADMDAYVAMRKKGVGGKALR